jgi:carotenoid 1,2-hydratase
VFSPYYAMARRRGAADPLNHSGLNVALYGTPRRWAMTERGRDSVRRSATTLQLGPSALEWDGEVLTIRIEEVTAPIPSRLRGVVRVRPAGINPRRFLLDAAGRHRWQPIAAVGRAEVEFEKPGLAWSGAAYFDTNDGDAPLERDFVEWDWCRAPLREGAAILYNAVRRDGTRQSLALRVDAGAQVAEMAVPSPALLPRTRWGIRRPTGVDAGHRPRVTQVLEDAPFYARSVVETRLCGEPATAVHESLSLDRFAALPIQMMLPFKIPRRWW